MYNENSKPLSIADDYLLIETSYINPPLNFRETIEKIKRKGYSIILAHPERYQYIDTGDYIKLKSDGFLFFQLNFLSPVGYYGEQVRMKTEYLLKNGFYDFMGTEIYNLDTHRRAFDQRSLNIKQINKINILITNNLRFF
jgi:tyrosine-protein phosphatase YwqE